MDVIVGTAGHIDHGKTALVKALTGIDADRLPEEKKRGITIDIGFAEMRDAGVSIGFVDVPGHERFVKNMLAGASGIDIVMVIIAADEGVMPQTREHFDICRLLKVGAGVIVLTKTDLVDAETLELARMDAIELVDGSFLEDAPMFNVSSKTGAGLPVLKDGLVAAAKNIRRVTDEREARLSIDRSFSVKGFGAVVTGTLASGEIAEGDELELLPDGKKIRVRGVQTHNRDVARAQVGQRTAINLGGIAHDEIERGMVLTSPGALTTTQAFDAEVEVLPDSAKPLRSRQRVRLHIGTAEVLARVAVLDGQSLEPGRSGLVQFRLESPVAAAFADRFIVRSYSPQRTIAGGRLLDPMARRYRQSEAGNVGDLLRSLAGSADGDGNTAEMFVRKFGESGTTIAELRKITGLRTEVIKRLADAASGEKRIVDAGGVLITKSAFDAFSTAAIDVIERFHRTDNLSRGVQRETLREQVFRRTRPEVFRAVIDGLVGDGKIVSEQDVFKLASHETQLSPGETLVRERLRKAFTDAGLEVPKIDEALQTAATGSGLDAKAARKVFQLLVTSGELTSVTTEFYFRTDALENLAARLRESARTSGDAMIDVARFKEIAAVSRKYAIPLLEYFDRTRVTVRVGDKRQIMG